MQGYKRERDLVVMELFSVLTMVVDKKEHIHEILHGIKLTNTHTKDLQAKLKI